MHQIVCRLGLCPDPTGRAYSAPPDLLPGLGGGAPGKREGRREGEKEGRGGEEGWEGKGGDGVPECPNPELATLLELVLEGSMHTVQSHRAAQGHRARIDSRHANGAICTIN